MYAASPGVLDGCAGRIIFCSSLFSVVVLANEEVKADALWRSVWCWVIAFCCPLLLVAFVCAVFILKGLGLQWGGMWGEWEGKPPTPRVESCRSAHGRA